jgi:hypothetical protein
MPVYGNVALAAPATTAIGRCATTACTPTPETGSIAVLRLPDMADPIGLEDDRDPERPREDE